MGQYRLWAPLFLPLPLPLHCALSQPLTRPVLLEAPRRTDKPVPRKHVVLLAIDLTRAVVDEALSIPASVIVAYRQYS